MVKFRIRLMEEKDFETVRKIREDGILEYYKYLREMRPEAYSIKEVEDDLRRRKVMDADLLNFYLRTGSSFVAEVEDKIVGFVLSQTIEFMRDSRRMIWVEHIEVKSEFRRRGIGYSLLSKVIKYAKEHSISQIESTINPNNEASIRLQQKLGFSVKDWKVASFKVA